MRIVRLVGFGLALVAALLAFFLLAPDDSPRYQPIAVEGNAELIDAAFGEYEANATNAGDDLAVQTMVNGWVARDLLYIVANQLDALSAQISVLSAQADGIAVGDDPDDRVPALLLVAVVAFAFHAATLPYVEAAPRPAVARAGIARVGHERDDTDAWQVDDDDDDDDDDDYDDWHDDDGDADEGDRDGR